MKKAHIAFGALALVGVLLAWNALLLSPKSRQRDEVKGQVASAQEEGDMLRAELEGLRRAKKSEEADRAALQRISDLMPGDEGMADFIRALDDLAARTQVDWASLSPSGSAPGATGGSISISINLSGTFFEILDYLEGLGQLQRLVVVDSIQLNGGATTGSDVTLQAAVAGRRRRHPGRHPAGRARPVGGRAARRRELMPARKKPDQPAAPAPAKGRGRRLLVVGGLAVVALAFAASRLLAGGGDDTLDASSDATVTQAGATSPAAPADHGDHGDHGTAPPRGADHAVDVPLRDPFCPLVTADGAPPVSCAARLRHPVAVTAPLKLVEVFVSERMPHARVQVGEQTKVLHIGDGFEGYRADSLEGACGVFSRGGEAHRLCAGEEWAGAPA